MDLSVSPLPTVHTSTTITVKQREARLNTEDTVPPVPEVPPSVFVLTHGGIACNPKSIQRIQLEIQDDEPWSTSRPPRPPMAPRTCALHIEC